MIKTKRKCVKFDKN